MQQVVQLALYLLITTCHPKQRIYVADSCCLDSNGNGQQPQCCDRRNWSMGAAATYAGACLQMASTLQLVVVLRKPSAMVRVLNASLLVICSVYLSS